MGYMKKNNKKKNKKKITVYPTGVDRMDKELLAEIKFYYNLCNDIQKTAVAYHVAENMARYAVDEGKDCNSIGGNENDGSRKR